MRNPSWNQLRMSWDEKGPCVAPATSRYHQLRSATRAIGREEGKAKEWIQKGQQLIFRVFSNFTFPPTQRTNTVLWRLALAFFLAAMLRPSSRFGRTSRSRFKRSTGTFSQSSAVRASGQRRSI